MEQILKQDLDHLKVSINQANDIIIKGIKDKEISTTTITLMTNKQFMERYDLVSSISDRGNSQELQNNLNDENKKEDEIDKKIFDLHQNFIIEYIKNEAKQIQKIQNKSNDKAFIEAVNGQYRHFLLYVRWMNKIFAYLNRFYLKLTDKFPNQSSLLAESFKIYRQYYFEQIKENLLKITLKFQKKVRDNSIVLDTKILQNIIQIFINIGFEKNINWINEQSNNKDQKTAIELNIQSNDAEEYYKQYFLNDFKIHIESYYQEQVQQHLHLQPHDFVMYVLDILYHEEQYIEYYYKISRKEILDVITEVIIHKQAQRIIEDPNFGLSYILEQERNEFLTKLYKFLIALTTDNQKVIDIFCKNFKKYIVENGIKIYQTVIKNMQPKDHPENVIKQYIDFRNKINSHISNQLSNDISIQKTRDESFRNFLNREERSVQFCAIFCDQKMRANLQNEQEIEQILNEIVGIFQYFNNKDSFLNFYQKYLKDRLLKFQVKNNEMEYSLIQKFQVETGKSSVHKLLTMMKDMQTGDEFYQKNVKLFKDNSINIYIYSLQKSSWPVEQEEKLPSNIPAYEDLYRQIDFVITTFSQIFKQRKYDWIYNYGKVELVFTSKQKYFLSVNPVQMKIIILFNVSDEISLSDLSAKSGLEEDEVQFQLDQFVKLKLLSCQTNAYKVNLGFTNEQRKINCLPRGKKANAKQQEQNEQMNRENKEQMEKYRGQVIDSNVVRIMKGRKELLQKDLINELFTLIKLFTPDVKQIKKRIENLIEKDYLERDDSDQNFLRYIP